MRLWFSKSNKSVDLTDRAFRIGLYIKGIDGLFECLGGILLLLIKQSQLDALARTLTEGQLSRNPNDFIANHILKSVHALTGASLIFASLYLLSHGVVKLVLVVEVLREKLWAYVALIYVTAGFVVYQLYRITLVKFSISLTLLTVFDLLIIYLAHKEYGRQKEHMAARHEARVRAEKNILKNINKNLPAGKYILAVSGGVDSMVLMHALNRKSKIKLIIAHFNHGIRQDSDKDEALVKNTAGKYKLKVEIGQGKLGAKASEEVARNARYGFLEGVRKKYRADSIITAHHQDDLIETAVINILRGTGRRGVSAIANNPSVIRPLLNVPKADLLSYAGHHRLKWREDSTNADPKYLRNKIRREVLPNLTAEQKNQFIKNIQEITDNNKIADALVATISQSIETKGKIDRYKFTMLPDDIAKEIIIYWLRQKSVMEYDKKIVERLVVTIKTAKSGTRHDVKDGLRLIVNDKVAFFTRTE
jgi:tRNA(Ile)-lysidine synthase